MRAYNIYRIGENGHNTRVVDGVLADDPEAALLGFFDGTARIADGQPSCGVDCASENDEGDLFFVTADVAEGEDGYHSFALLVYVPPAPATCYEPSIAVL